MKSMMKLIKMSFCTERKITTIQQIVRAHRSALNNRVAPDLQKIPFEEVYVQKNQIETRILKLLYDSKLVNLKSFEFNQDLRKDLRLDSLDITALLTSVQHEFTTVFEDRVFEGIKNLQQVVTILSRDEKIF